MKGGIFIYTYFKMLESMAHQDNKEYSILDLTISLAKSGGYIREIYTFKNGNKRERTKYSQQFDDVLVAKWLCFYKKLFMSKLATHPELSEYHINIINKTFFIVMNCLNIDKLVCDDIINRYVNMALVSRIGEAMYSNKSKYNNDTYNKGTPTTFLLKNAIDNRALSLNRLEEDLGDKFAYENFNDEDLEIVLRDGLATNPMGSRVLDALLNCRTRFSLKKVDQYIYLNSDEFTCDTKKYIVDAYNYIKSVLIDFTNKDMRFRRASVSSVKFSFEVV